MTGRIDMISWLWLIPALIIGGTFGFFVAAICVASGKRTPKR